MTEKFKIRNLNSCIGSFWYYTYPWNLLIIFLVTFLFQGSRDNMSIVLVTFPAAPKVSEEAVLQETELETFLKQSIIGKYR